jgi:hypothetical protein
MPQTAEIKCQDADGIVEALLKDVLNIGFQFHIYMCAIEVVGKCGVVHFNGFHGDELPDTAFPETAKDLLPDITKDIGVQ